MAPRGQNLFSVGKGQNHLRHYSALWSSKGHSVKIAWGEWGFYGEGSLKRLLRGLIMKKDRKVWL